VDEVRQDVALSGRDIFQINVAGVAGSDAFAAGDSDGDRAGGSLSIRVWTGFFQEIVCAARV
jgi:hypothetical protein